MNDKKDKLQKIYLKLVGIDFNQLSFQNHILLSEIIEEIYALTS